MAKKPTLKGRRVTTRPRAPALHKLTSRQEAFAREYIKDFNAKEACLRVTPTVRHPAKAGYQMKRTPAVAKLILELMQTSEENTKVDRDFIHIELVKQYRKADMSAGIGVESKPAERASAIQALVNLGKHVDIMAFRENLGVGKLDGSDFDYTRLNDAQLVALDEILSILTGGNAAGSDTARGEGGDSEEGAGEGAPRDPAERSGDPPAE